LAQAAHRYLGHLPKVGVTIALPGWLKEELDLYAAEHSRPLRTGGNHGIDPAYAGSVTALGSRLAQPQSEANGARQLKASLPASGANPTDERST
jgi:hypothetical protein